MLRRNPAKPELCQIIMRDIERKIYILTIVTLIIRVGTHWFVQNFSRAGSGHGVDVVVSRSIRHPWYCVHRTGLIAITTNTTATTATTTIITTTTTTTSILNSRCVPIASYWRYNIAGPVTIQFLEIIVVFILHLLRPILCFEFLLCDY